MRLPLPFDARLFTLHPLKQEAKNTMEIAGFDVETMHIPTPLHRKSGKTQMAWRQEFLLGSVVTKKSEKTFYDRAEMADYLCSRTFLNHYTMATNLEFDAGILYPDMHEKFTILHRHKLKALLRTEHPERTEYGEQRSRTEKWVFVDSSNYVPASVEQLGKIVGIPKMPHPPTMAYNTDAHDLLARKPENKDEWDQLAAYCVNDARITYQFGETFKSFCNSQNMQMKLTLASCGIDFWRRNYQTMPLIREPERYLQKHFLGSFRGGMTVLYKRGKVPSTLYSYDINSAYPYAMSEGVDGKGGYPDPSNFQRMRQMSIAQIEAFEGICDCTVHMPPMYCPPLGYREKNGKLIFPIGTFRNWFTHIELRLALKLGATLEPHEGIYYRTLFTPFRDAVHHLYDLRMKYGKEHYFYTMVKTLMNAGLFGKWGMNYQTIEEIFSGDELTIASDGSATRLKNGKQIPLQEYILRDIPGHSQICIAPGEGRPGKTTFPILSSYTTAICRLHLWQLVSAHEKYLCYSDTDSAQMLKKCFDDDAKTLGAMKLEKESDDAVLAALKVYRIGSVVKSKGVGKFMSTPQQFSDALDTHTVSMNQWLRLRGAWSLGVGAGTIFQTQKHLKLDDTKRDWQGKSFDPHGWQDSEPLRMTLK